jgi:hypothetical protein
MITGKRGKEQNLVRSVVDIILDLFVIPKEKYRNDHCHLHGKLAADMQKLQDLPMVF